VNPDLPADVYARTMSRLSRHARLRVFRIFDRALDPCRGVPGPGMDYRLLSEAQTLDLCAEPTLELTWDLRPAKARAAYSRGDVCAAAFIKNELAGYCWFAFSAAPHMDRAWIDFPSEVVYTYKSYVRPVHRGRGIAGALYRFADPLWLGRGRRRAMICVESHNFASIAAAGRAGFSPAGYAGYLRGARFGAWRTRPAAAYGLRFFAPPA
jgi:GNAT superfamily N-acetyltransferase